VLRRFLSTQPSSSYKALEGVAEGLPRGSLYLTPGGAQAGSRELVWEGVYPAVDGLCVPDITARFERVLQDSAAAALEDALS
jgi:hypothetical protein